MIRIFVWRIALESGDPDPIALLFPGSQPVLIRARSVHIEGPCQIVTVERQKGRTTGEESVSIETEGPVSWTLADGQHGRTE